MPILNINVILYAIFLYHNFCIKLFANKSFETLKSFIQTYLGITSFIHTTYIHTIFSKNFFKFINYHWLESVYSQRKRLYYKNIRKLVNNNSRKEISLTKYKTA